MGNAVAKFEPDRFKVGIVNMAQGGVDQVGYLRMDKGGVWCWGQDDIEVTSDQRLYVDPMGFVHGWQCWADTDIPGVSSAKLGEEIVPMFDPLPARPAQVPENGRPWAELRGMSLLLDGEKLVYSTTSVGGRNAIAKLAQTFYDKYVSDPSKMIAVVQLGNDSYKHKNKTYGKIYVPIIEVVDWVATLPQEAVEEAPAKPDVKVDNGKKPAAKKTAKAASKKA